MSIIFNKKTQTFHLFNENISYIMKILDNGQLGNLYFGESIKHQEDFDHFLEMAYRPMTAYVYEEDTSFSLDHIKQEYPAYGTTDFRHPAVEVCQANGSKITSFSYISHVITKGKPKLKGLPATYVEEENEAETLIIILRDELIGLELQLKYTIFLEYSAIARSAMFVHKGLDPVDITTAMSVSLDLPDSEYEWLQLSGAWSRERHVITRRLEQGIQSIGSTRGTSSHNHNPFVALKRSHTTENKGEAIGFSLIYSGNFLAQAEVDNWDVARVILGINPLNFSWKLEHRECFQTPEAVIVYSNKGLNTMSQTFHELYSKRLARGYWRDRERPILINNWEATYFDFTEEKLLSLASSAKRLGVELFVLDDGWFKGRRDDTAGLGDWSSDPKVLPNGISSLANKIESIGLKFGLWFEPEMVNINSNLYRSRPEWVISTPGRTMSHGRNEYVLDFSRKEVVDHIFQQMYQLISSTKISYIKWDMNRCITECYSKALAPDRQGEVFHRYILGVYDLYERLTSAFPQVLFESCASGGGRFDPGMLYYAPQAWTSDDSDALERIKIQYGSSYCYPISSMGAHVSIVPNHQVFRNTPLKTRANVAYFGAFGYELDFDQLTPGELNQVQKQIKFMKQYRKVLQFGMFYRLVSPFDNNRIASWMVVSEDKKTALVGYYKILNEVNGPFRKVKLKGLDPELCYVIDGGEKVRYGDELMNFGLITSDSSAGQVLGEQEESCDFDSHIYVLQAK